MSTRPRRVGITDVARHAGVSVTTVSHVLSGRRPVSTATSAKVRSAIDRLGYRPNELARSMRAGRTNTVALVIPDITNPHYTSVARGLQDVLRSADHYAIVFNTDADPELEHTAVQKMLTRVDAFALSGYARDVTDIQPAIDAGKPVVWIGGASAGPGYDVVTSPDRQTGADATSYLLDRGYRRIAFVTTPEPVGAPARRVEGHHDALRGAGIEPDPELLVRRPATRDGGAEAMRHLRGLASPPDAVLCTNDIVAIGALTAARELDLDVPGEVAVMGFDDIDAAVLVSPRLTTMANPSLEIGRAVGRTLLQRLNHEDDLPPHELVFPAALRARESA